MNSDLCNHFEHKQEMAAVELNLSSKFKSVIRQNDIDL